MAQIHTTLNLIVNVQVAAHITNLKYQTKILCDGIDSCSGGFNIHNNFNLSNVISIYSCHYNHGYFFLYPVFLLVFLFCLGFNFLFWFVYAERTNTNTYMQYHSH